jgi:cytochrome c oxidase subunit 2
MSQPTHSAAPGSPRAFDNASRLAALFIGILAGIAGLVVGIANPFVSDAASTQGVLIDVLFGITLGLATAVFVIVQGVLLYSIIRFGREEGDETDAAPIRGNHKLEFIWTAVPAVVILFIGLLSYQVLAEIEQPTADQLTVEVKAIQYAWQFYYPEQDITSNELHIPLNRQIHLKLRSNDVIHSFWVPEFRIKKDVMPDRLTETFITGSELGTYPVVCAELCGAGHAVMRSQVVVESDANFQSWLASQGVAQAQAAAAAAADPFAAGKAAFNVYGCNACHALASAGAVGAIGPKLDGIGTRAGRTVAGQSAEEYIRTSIVKPAAYLTPGFTDLMPKDYEQRATAADLDALVKYLMEEK